MKRIIHSCFLLTLLFLSKNILAQPFTATITPVQCYNPGNNTALGVVQFPSPAPCGTGASYSWTAVPAASLAPGCTVGQTVAVAGGTACNFSFPCCGNYTIFCACYAAGPPGPPCDTRQMNVLIECPSLGTVTPVNSGTICAGSTATLNIAGGSTWTWTPGNVITGSVFLPSPLATTCYSANGTTANGCSVTIPAAACVTVQSLNVNISPPSQTICAGTQVTLTANTSAAPISNVTYQWYQVPPTVPLGTSSTQIVAPLANAVYSLNAFVSTCSVALTNSIAVASNLSMLAAASSPSVCQNETFTLTGTSSATSFTWTQIAGPGTATFNPSGSATANPTTAVGPGTYSVIGSNSVCASTPATVTVLLTNFTPTLTASSAAVCAGETFTLTGSGGTANTYTWGTLSPLPPTSICVNCSSVQSITQNTTTTYVVFATSPGGCQSSQTISVGMTPNTTVALVASAAAVCASSPVTLTASGATNYTFVSSTSGTLPGSPTASVVIDNPTSNTTYTVFATGANGYCGSTATVSVNMITGGTLTLTTTSSAAIICAGQSSSLSVSGAPNFTWTPGATLTSTTGATTIASPTATTIYTVTGSNNGGCIGFSTITVSISPTPTIFITSNPTGSYVCAGFTSTLTAQGATSYTWTGSNFSIPVNQPSISVSPGTSSNAPCTTFTVIGGSAGANCPSLPANFILCRATPLNVQVSVSPIQGTTCIETNYNPVKRSKPLVLTATGAQTYVWFPYNPAYMTYSIGPQTTVRPPTSTCYTVTGNTPNCSGSTVICVNVIPQFTMNVVPPLPAICLGDSINLSIVNIQQPLAVGPASLFTYFWNDPPTSPPPSITAQNTQTVTAFPQTTTTYSVEVFDARLCASLPRLVTVTVLPQPVTAVSWPTINNVLTNTVCFVGLDPSARDNQLDLTATLSNLSLLPYGVTPTYTWTGPGNPQSVVTPSNNPAVTIVAPHRLPAVVVFSVVTGYNGISGCTRMDTISVRVIDCRPIIPSVVNFTTDINPDDTICVQNCITFNALTDTLAGGPQTFTWTFKGGLPLNAYEHSPTVCYDLPGEYDVVLEVANPYPVLNVPPGSFGVKAFYKHIKVVDYPNVTIVAPGRRRSDTTIRFSQSIVLTATNASSYVWSPHYSISTLTGSNVTVNPTKTTQYIVTGYKSKACFSSDTINVIVNEDCGDMFVPNAFSPNGDNVNDVLLVRGVCLETLTFMIFNRWGEKVFETNDVNVGWDGTYHGEKMNTGVFVYRLEGKTYEGKGFSLKGNITLMR